MTDCEWVKMKCTKIECCTPGRLPSIRSRLSCSSTFRICLTRNLINVETIDSRKNRFPPKITFASVDVSVAGRPAAHCADVEPPRRMKNAKRHPNIIQKFPHRNRVDGMSERTMLRNQQQQQRLWFINVDADCRTIRVSCLAHFSLSFFWFQY